MFSQASCKSTRAREADGNGGRGASLRHLLLLWRHAHCIGLELTSAGKLVMAVTNLYNTASQHDLLRKRWEDLETMITY